VLSDLEKIKGLENRKKGGIYPPKDPCSTKRGFNAPREDLQAQEVY